MDHLQASYYNCITGGSIYLTFVFQVTHTIHLNILSFFIHTLRLARMDMKRLFWINLSFPPAQCSIELFYTVHYYTILWNIWYFLCYKINNGYNVTCSFKSWWYHRLKLLVIMRLSLTLKLSCSLWIDANNDLGHVLSSSRIVTCNPSNAVSNAIREGLVLSWLPVSSMSHGLYNYPRVTNIFSHPHSSYSTSYVLKQVPTYTARPDSTSGCSKNYFVTRLPCSFAVRGKIKRFQKAKLLASTFCSISYSGIFVRLINHKRNTKVVCNQ